ncbi:MAG: hypothetical protein LIO65_00170 [Odoribacter sp.]|nr:hypothetical protein [Odoribacter sp.]
MSLNEFQDKVADFLIDFEGIAKVITAHALTHNAFSEGSEKLVQNAFSAKRSGDILYTLLPAWVSELKDKEDFYFRYSKRSKIPVYFYGAGVYEPYVKECKITDITPTVCEIIGITSPYTSKGKYVFSKKVN